MLIIYRLKLHFSKTKIFICALFIYFSVYTQLRFKNIINYILEQEGTMVTAKGEIEYL